MSKLNKIFQTVPVKIPERSGFDLSHEHLFTATIGTEVPAACFEVLPGDTVSVGNMTKVTLPPFAVPFMGRVDVAVEAFFVPNRILWKGWQSFITQNNGVQSVSAGGSSILVPTSVPLVSSASMVSSSMGRGTLADYLGFNLDGLTSQFPDISALKFLAYQKVMDDWYRDENNMKPFFAKNVATSTAVGADIEHLLNSVYTSSGTPILRLEPYTVSNVNANLVDTTIGLGSLRQRCWAKDYFTTATTRPQSGAESSVTFDTSGNTGSFTISTLRAANSLQKWLERNNIAGTEYGSQILAHFGVTPPDAVLDKAVLLGQNRFPVYVGSVENNSAATAGSVNAKNPFNATLGSAAGFGSGAQSDRLVDDFTAKEHGFIMILYCIVPHSYYDSGYDRELRHVTYGDFAWPEFANIGDQPIESGELVNTQNFATTFGYNQRYSEYKFKNDRISGLLHDGETLDVYALKRGWSANPSLGKAFLEIPKNYLDQVFVWDDPDGEPNVSIVDSYFDIRMLRVLPEYSMPSL